jgi:uncharacterized protein YndB with AHSA1/START domain
VILRILIVIAVAIAAVLAFALISAASRPETFRVERSITIDAAPERIFPLIEDFHRWPSWAPQDKEDPSMTRVYSGAASGVGAVSDWNSKGSAGKGRMSIIASMPPTRVTVKVDFVKPFVAHNVNEFILEPTSGPAPATKVTWTMQGSNLYVMKAMSAFVNMDRFMGKHFEKGLTDLKKVAEGRP